MRRLMLVAAVLVFALGVTAQVQAALVQVPIPATNTNLQTWTNGSYYPAGPSTLTIGGIDFSLVPYDGHAGTTLGAYEFGTNSPLSIYPNIYGATKVYTIMNSAWGQYGAYNGYVEFVGASGVTDSFSLYQGDNIRDHNNDGWQNSAPAVVASAYFDSGQIRLDMQEFDLPSTFANTTLTEIEFVGAGSIIPNYWQYNGDAFVAAVTVNASSTIPEPSTLIVWSLLGGISVAFGYWRRKRAA